MIRTFADPILKETCEPVAEGEDVSELIALMREAMAAEITGVGLAAPQVGATKRVIIVGKKERVAMINPEITFAATLMKKTENESCLSFPGVSVPVKRSTTIKVKWTDEDGKGHHEKFRDYPARIIQHEVDHLDGICRVGDRWHRDQAAKEALEAADKMDQADEETNVD